MSLTTSCRKSCERILIWSSRKMLLQDIKRLVATCAFFCCAEQTVVSLYTPNVFSTNINSRVYLHHTNSSLLFNLLSYQLLAERTAWVIVQEVSLGEFSSCHQLTFNCIHDHFLQQKTFIQNRLLRNLRRNGFSSTSVRSVNSIRLYHRYLIYTRWRIPHCGQAKIEAASQALFVPTELTRSMIICVFCIAEMDKVENSPLLCS